MVSPSHFLPAPACARRSAHSREIRLQAYERQDGLWDLEALIEDVKPQPLTTQMTHFDCGVPIHLMAIRITINEAMDVLEADAGMHRMPFPSICPEAQPRLKWLIGANLLKGFRQEVAKRIPASDRCTHLSELATLLPTLAVQTILQGKAAQQGDEALASRPMKIGACHALREDGPLVQTHYPQWFRPPAGT